MIKILIKLQLQNVLYSMFAKKNEQMQKRNLGRNIGKNAGKGVGFAILAVYIIGMFIFFFGSMFSEVAKVLIPAGDDSAYTAIVIMMSALFGVIGSVFITEKILFGAEDNEFLLSMPFKPSQILISRLISIYALSFAYGTLVIIPGIAVYFGSADVGLLKILFWIAAILLVPLVAVTVTVILAWAFAALTRRTKRKNMLTTAFSLVFLAAYLAFYTNIQPILTFISEKPEFVLLRVRQFAPNIYFLSTAIGEGSVKEFLFALLAIFVPAIIVLYILSRSFIKIATSSKNTAVYKYKRKELKRSSVRMAMTKKELSKLFGTPVYLINACFGSFILIILTALVAYKGANIIDLLPAEQAAALTSRGLEVLVPFILCAASAAMCAMTCTTGVALSVEGSTFDILKSMPLSFKDVILPKVYANIIVGYAPVLFLGIVAVIRCGLSVTEGIYLFTVPLLAQISISLWGMIMNISHPKFDWTNETTVVKQSASEMVTIFSSMGLSAVVAVVAVAFIMQAPTVSAGAAMASPAMLLLFLLLSVLNYVILMTVSKKKYNTL